MKNTITSLVGAGILCTSLTLTAENAAESGNQQVREKLMEELQSHGLDQEAIEKAMEEADTSGTSETTMILKNKGVIKGKSIQEIKEKLKEQNPGVTIIEAGEVAQSQDALVAKLKESGLSEEKIAALLKKLDSANLEKVDESVDLSQPVTKVKVILQEGENKPVDAEGNEITAETVEKLIKEGKVEVLTNP